MLSGAMCKTLCVKVFLIFALLQWTEAKSQEVYGLEFQGTNSSFRTQQTINSIISLLNSTLNSIPSKLNSTLNSIPTKLNSTLSIIPNTIKSILGGVLSLTTTLTSALGGLGSLISKPSGGGGGGIPFPDLSSLLGKLNGTGISKPGGGIGGCDPDILLLSNLPGIFIVVPIAILAVSILVGAIAAAIIAIGGLGEHITESIYDKTDFANIANMGNTNHKIDSTVVLDDPNYYGNLQSGSASPSPYYAASANNYGALSPGSSPWVYSAVDSLNKDFNKAYDTYSGVSQQKKLGQNGYLDQLGAAGSSSNTQHWSSNHVARAKQR